MQLHYPHQRHRIDIRNGMSLAAVTSRLLQVVYIVSRIRVLFAK